ncbi:hypothetical protein PINS_up013134 [Pythium insidiosum]|nr:hypothetical protein PINS_up013134 [Pythium insidiosum]
MATQRKRLPLLLLHQLDRDVLEHAVQRLTLHDLRTLASFPAQPHVLVHRSLAALQCVLLSMAPVHDAASVLQVTPWPLLRLEVLARSDELWRKMETRVRRLQRSPSDPRSALSTAQLRFVTQTLVAPLQTPMSTTSEDPPSSEETETDTATLLARVGRVSVIAESVAAFVLLCAHLTLRPPSPRHRRPREASPDKRPMLAAMHASVSVSASGFQPARGNEGAQRSNQQLKAETSVACSTRALRCGLKTNGRFYLLRFTAPGVGAGAGLRSGRWRGIMLRPLHRDGTRDARGDSGSTDLQALLLPFTQRLVDTARLAPLALRAVLLWDARCQLRRLDPLCLPQRSLQSAPALPLFIVVLEMHAATRAPSLTAVGRFSMTESLGPSLVLSMLREQIETRLRALFPQRDSASFSFFHRGALLSRLEEPNRLAVELLPLAALVAHDGDRPFARAQKKVATAQLVTIANELQLQLVTTLSAAAHLPSPDLNSDEATEAAVLYAMQQPLTRGSPETGFLVEMLGQLAVIRALPGASALADDSRSHGKASSASPSPIARLS